ncbi:ROK family transcriptional regulator [Microvirga terrae]|uniref:ROK family transcriptional regulator n=1 Tax=Microvirga terrae TaxID=2740529 RepID=A0ABY5RQL3_9HYPH|nr:MULTISPECIES: ROK family transcriptional regulator [Microvirga]MBQ0824517.1 ROK family transcriptional regulator [Microvirga sp. HBU67558]UVF19318.1 ROK family transcriptional regulator [Microvirga terrae]
MPRKPKSGAPSTIGSNPERNRFHNRRVVLDVVRQLGPVGRMEISRHAHLSTQAVSNIVEDLVADGLLIRTGRLRAGRGLPPIQFAVNPNGGMTAGVEIAADHICTLLIDIGGHVRAQRHIPIPQNDPEAVLPVIKAEIDAAQTQLQPPVPQLLGVGVVMPGPFNVDGMTSVGPTTLSGWLDFDAVAHIGGMLGVPVTLENDATAAAVGERLHGVAKDLKNFCLIYFGQGLGLGIMIDGRPYRGANGNAGEIGHVLVEKGGRLCSCGQKGCLEAYASFHALAQQLAAAGVDPIDDADLERLHRERHPVVLGWIREAAGYLAPQVAMLENLFDPEAIVLGGVLPPGLLEELVEAMQPLPLSVARRRNRSEARLIHGRTGRSTAALGAAALPLLETMTPRLDKAHAARREQPTEEISLAG